MTELERLLRETLDEDAAGYVVGSTALTDVRRRLRHGGAAPAVASRHRFTRAAIAVGVAAAVVGLAALAVPFAHGGHDAETAAVLGVSPGPATSPPAAVAPIATLPFSIPPPPAVAGIRTVGLGFAADRLVLAGRNVWAFGRDAQGQTRVAHLVDLRVVAAAQLPHPVCSASVQDASTALALVFGTDPTCRGRATLGLLDPQQLTLAPATAVALGGDALVRPEGIYAVSAGTLALLDPVTLLPAGPVLHLGSETSLVNLANDPNQSRLFATVLDPARHTTTLVTFEKSTLHRDRISTLDAESGALPYATGSGAVWVSIVSAQGSQAELRTTSGGQGPAAFSGFPLMTSYAESGTRLWSLTPDGQLRCASLTSGTTMGQSRVVAAAGPVAADEDNVYAVDGQGLAVFTPAAGCAAG